MFAEIACGPLRDLEKRLNRHEIERVSCSNFEGLFVVNLSTIKSSCQNSRDDQLHGDSLIMPDGHVPTHPSLSILFCKLRYDSFFRLAVAHYDHLFANELRRDHPSLACNPAKMRPPRIKSIRLGITQHQEDARALSDPVIIKVVQINSSRSPRDSFEGARIRDRSWCLMERT
jgi:hypothetical protein